MASLVSRRRNATVLDAFTEREREVLGLMAEGRSNAAIARTLFLSPKTAESHVASVFGKLKLPATSDDNRRVLAVLSWLRADSAG